MSSNCPSGTIRYTIVAGDTLYNLARKFNTTVQAIMAVNPNINPNFLQIGQVICIPTAQSEMCPPNTFPYTIQAGDTFLLLARRFHTTVAAIQAANPGVDPNRLQIGQKICIPIAPAPAPCPQGSFAYTIKAGDTLYALANRYNTTVNAILALNPGIDPRYLRIGQVICIPTTQPGMCPPNTFPYTIQTGDTFFLLARRFHTTVAAIQAANPGVDPNRLQIGQRICIPR
ncbi:LysM peptidoglycan-binding domain-containing protein [Garciella nitratireducens]|uniref:LysM repeat-containing protein n=1 Tax=Garciella nitratireducens DSM 15102 TaxID=1121911 RepID=A0A1T4ND68_9FIRM|nr:LysM peptidoglycan-binding domain-containing protein [Garciella nitratireducens]SJZ77271.1 LysM repeat-containing protein [Garciella nitratireducens DSM 15102]